MKTVYLVTRGSYSDYHVCCVCSTMKKAEYAKRLYNADNDIEPYDVNHFMGHPVGTLWYEVTMDRDGNVSKCKIENPEWANDVEWKPYGDGNRVTFFMWAKTDKHAIKIANERRVALIASEQWTTDFAKWRDEQYAKVRP